MAIGFGLLLSVNALLPEEASFHFYPGPRPRPLPLLAAVSVLENFGYLQLISIGRLWGLLHWLAGAKGRWGEMRRTASSLRGSWHSR